MAIPVRGYSAAVLTAVVVLIFQRCVDALDKRVARTPPMGYNTWYDVGGGINESYIKSVAAAMQARGLVAAGYNYLNLDDGFIAPSNHSPHQRYSLRSKGFCHYLALLLVHDRMCVIQIMYNYCSSLSALCGTCIHRYCNIGIPIHRYIYIYIISIKYGRFILLE